MRDDSVYFGHWLGRQGNPGILPNQWVGCMNVMTRLETADLLSILFHGDKDHAMKALHYLRERFEEEMHELNELFDSQHFEEVREDAFNRY